MNEDEMFDKWYTLGKVERLREFASEFKEMSGEAFADGRDDLAKEYRRISKGLEELYARERAEYDETYRKSKEVV
jgi:hypothetical protein